jgi:formylglycine-generating enzyme required for sulfatase activity
VSIKDSTKKVSVSATLRVPPNSYTVPVPYAVEAATSVDAQALREELVALREELVAAGVLPSVNMIIVKGGTLPKSSKLSEQHVVTFFIGKYEVTLDEWKNVRTWAVANGYSDLAIGVASAGNHPVQNVSWYDVLKWSNAKSQKEGLMPVYQVDGAVYKTGQSVPTVNSSSNGYRLPTETEWEWAARGGVNSQNYTYSGSNDVNAVAWYDGNSGGMKAVGTKLANELGFHDMSGNVWEWCWDLQNPLSPPSRRLRGGSWANKPDAHALDAQASRSSSAPAATSDSIGFRVARSSGN